MRRRDIQHGAEYLTRVVRYRSRIWGPTSTSGHVRVTKVCKDHVHVVWLMRDGSERDPERNSLPTVLRPRHIWVEIPT